jgi:hypothetical protein
VRVELSSHCVHPPVAYNNYYIDGSRLEIVFLYLLLVLLDNNFIQHVSTGIVKTSTLCATWYKVKTLDDSRFLCSSLSYPPCIYRLLLLVANGVGVYS